MSLTIEDGTVVAGANSYVETSVVDTYCSDRNYASWASLATAEKEAAVLRAMTYIDSLPFKGYKTAATNPLQWPRIYVYEDSAYVPDPVDWAYYGDISYREIPDALKKATCHAAWLESVTPDVLLQTGTTNIKREKVDVIETEYFAPVPAKPSFDIIYAILKDLLKIDLLNNRGGFAQVLRT